MHPTEDLATDGSASFERFTCLPCNGFGPRRQRGSFDSSDHPRAGEVSMEMILSLCDESSSSTPMSLSPSLSPSLAPSVSLSLSSWSLDESEPDSDWGTEHFLGDGGHLQNHARAPRVQSPITRALGRIECKSNKKTNKCRFFYSKKGCRRGASCRFEH